MRTPTRSFNVFDVMRHGTHEKQYSNVFAWLLDPTGTHGLGDTFQRLFLEQVNAGLGQAPFPTSGYSVRQEVNTSVESEGWDIADLVLEHPEHMVVVENYYTSSGHGHGYGRYLRLGTSAGLRTVVVMLCGRHNPAELTGGWEQAVVVTHADLMRRLRDHLARDPKFGAANPEQLVFIDHMVRHFTKEADIVRNEDLIDFVSALCAAGEAERYRGAAEQASVRFADDLREQARVRFAESRELLQRVKRFLASYADSTVRDQLTAALGPGATVAVDSRASGIYQWTVTLRIVRSVGTTRVMMKFGPSAWWANERDDDWLGKVSDADYRRLLLGRSGQLELRQSSVSLADVFSGLSRDDDRLCRDILDLLDES